MAHQHVDAALFEGLRHQSRPTTFAFFGPQPPTFLGPPLMAHRRGGGECGHCGNLFAQFAQQRRCTQFTGR